MYQLSDRPPVPQREQRFELTVVPDIEGPKVRLGFVWFLVSVGAALAGPVPLALVLGAAAAAAVVEVVRLHDEERPVYRGRPPVGAWLRDLWLDRLALPGILGAVALPLAALGGPASLGRALPAVVVVVLFHRLFTPSDRGPIGDLGSLLGAVLVFGLAASGPVLLAGIGPAAAVVGLLLVCAYDAGDYLVGSENATRWEGPLAGIAAVAVVAFTAAVLQVPPVTGRVAVALGVVVAVAGPLGPPTAAVLAGHSRHRARFVRRIDSLVVVGPLAPWVVAAVLA